MEHYQYHFTKRLKVLPRFSFDGRPFGLAFQGAGLPLTEPGVLLPLVLVLLGGFCGARLRRWGGT